MPWKMDGDKIAMADGKPVFVYSDGREAGIDGDALIGKIEELTGEQSIRRDKLKGFEDKLKAFDGIDPAKAAEALALVAKLDQKKLIDAGEVDRVTKSISDAYEAKIKESTERLTKTEATLFQEMIGGRFARSEFVGKSLTLAPVIAQDVFGKFFKIEDGKPVAYGSDGVKIGSREKPGHVADFDEALKILVDAHPSKATFIRAEIPNGGGSGGSGGGRTVGAGQDKTSTQRIADGLRAQGLA